jgi:diaminohydroxyphosphoribosylaminopyrimidine deaminase/5-amino-6-(5-phosphoribosylamino)uracil reductase
VLSGNLSDELKTLAAEGVTNLLVEGGATLIGSMLRDGLIDELQVYIAPKIVGDAEAVPAVRGLSCELIADATGLRLQSAERLGEDVFLNYLIR